MDRAPRPETTTRRWWVVISLILILLGCTNGKLDQDKIDRFKSGEALQPVEDLFKEKLALEDSDGSSKSASGKRPGFFEVPGGWALTQADEDILVYKLEHTSREQASVMISYDPLQKDDEAAREAELREQHKKIVGRLPSAFQQQEYREWRREGRPHIQTVLMGRRDEEAPEMIVSGYTVGIGHDSYTIFAAYMRSDQEALAEDIEHIVSSLKPQPDASGEGQEGSAPEPAPEEPAPEEPDPEAEELEGVPPRGDGELEGSHPPS